MNEKSLTAAKALRDFQQSPGMGRRDLSTLGWEDGICQHWDGKTGSVNTGSLQHVYSPSDTGNIWNHNFLCGTSFAH